MAIDPTKLLTTIPSGLRDPLFQSYREIAANYTEHRWEPSELNGGKFCEVTYCIVIGSLEGNFSAKPSKPSDMLRACRDIEKRPADAARVGDRSLRILIPRTLPMLYEIRNNRGVGHVGGDVNPNFLDATAVFGMASWILAELIRIFHGISTNDAQEAVDLLAERKYPLIWHVEDIRRVLDPTMSKRDQTLLLLHGKISWALCQDLCKWVEYSSISMFRRRILKPLHDERLIEYDKNKDRARISPTGVRDVESRILKSRGP